MNQVTLDGSNHTVSVHGVNCHCVCARETIMPQATQATKISL